MAIQNFSAYAEYSPCRTSEWLSPQTGAGLRETGQGACPESRGEGVAAKVGFPGAPC